MRREIQLLCRIHISSCTLFWEICNYNFHFWIVLWVSWSVWRSPRLNEKHDEFFHPALPLRMFWIQHHRVHMAFGSLDGGGESEDNISIRCCCLWENNENTGKMFKRKTSERTRNCHHFKNKNGKKGETAASAKEKMRSHVSVLCYEN